MRRVFYLFFLSFFICFAGFSQDNTLTFNKISNYNGLSNNSINCVFQDSRGFIWFGTLNGLNRFDGNDFLVFHNDPQDKSSISNDIITSICEDQNKTLWIGTAKGLNIYDPVTEKFQNFNNNPGEIKALVKSSISALYPAGQILWVGTPNKGIYCYDQATKAFNTNPLGGFSLSNKKINTIGEDRDHHVWVGTPAGLNRLTLDGQGKIIKVNQFYNTADNTSISNNKINAIYQDRHHNLWIGTSNGLNRLVNASSAQNKQPIFERYLTDKPTGDSLSPNDVTVVFEDRDNELWVGTDGGGLNRASLAQGTSKLSFSLYKKLPDNNNSLVQNQVFSMIQDVSGILWVGTINGIDEISKPGNQFHLFQNDPLVLNSLPNNNVAAIQTFVKNGVEYALIGTTGGISVSKVSDLHAQKKEFIPVKDNIGELDNRKTQCFFLIEPNTVWVGTKNGLRALDLETKEFVPTPAALQALPKSVVRQIHRDADGLIWIGTNQGLYVWNPVNNKLTKCLVNNNPAATNKYLNFIGTNSRNDIFAIEEDVKGHIWIGTWGHGLIRFKTGHPEAGPQYYVTAPEKNSLSSNYVTSLHSSKNGLLWIGTTEGLDLLRDPNSTSAGAVFDRYDASNGFSNNYIASVLEDDHQDLWIATLTGLLKFNTRSKQVLNFNFHYGNLTRENYCTGVTKDSKGYMYFGGINGLISFQPDSIHEDNYQYPIQLTDFQVFNRNEALPGANSYKNSLSKRSGNSISLDYSQYGFSFSFASLNYKIADRIAYAYQLEGIDRNWIYRNSNQRFASYTNLNPGNYTLKVKATNEYGIWSEPKDLLIITVLTPWWKTWWAYLFYAIAFCLTAYGLGAYVLEKERLKHSLNLERLEKEKVKEVDELKFRYFTNISHEFRTPLTLILGPLEQLYKQLPTFNEQVKGNLMLIQHNVNHLLRLINQLMDFRKAEQGNLKLEVYEGNISDFIIEVKDSFEPMAQKKSIAFDIHQHVSDIQGWCDFDKLEKILNNLIYNALSFSRDNGEVIIGVDLRKEGKLNELNLRVKDNGEGIPRDEIDKIFNTFYQASNQKRSFSSGYGIGLSLTKQLVDLHKGKIVVISDMENGTVFDITIPIDRENYKDFEVAETPKEITNKYPFVFSDPEQATEMEAPVSDKDIKKPLLLLVDDNPEIRKYLVKCFKEKYRLVEATDGIDGLQKADTMSPDLVISDVMMPLMDGNEFCYKIKTNLATSHIPVILLTALMSTEHLIQGLETGADAYITKPFHYDVLEIQVRNLIESRKNLRKHFVHEAITEPQEVTVNSVDEVFLAKAMKVIENNIKDFDYSIEQFVDDMAVGRSVLYRKLKQLTDQSPNEFIRTVRLKRAAQLLKKHSGTISEVGYEVGFIDPGYFARCFKKQFNVTPKEFISENMEVNNDPIL